MPLPVDPTTHNATSEDGQVLVIPSFLHVIPLFALGVTTYLLTTLTTSHVSLLGIVYLLLGTAMLYLHPKNLVVPSVQNGQTHPDNGLRALMLMPLDLRSTFNLKMVADSYQLRSYAWLPLSLLGWTAFLDAFLQLGFSCFSLLESVMDISMLSDIVEETPDEEPVTIRPMQGFPLIRDLVTDTRVRIFPSNVMAPSLTASSSSVFSKIMYGIHSLST